jgi:morphogenetic protein associated with SpoVID
VARALLKQYNVMNLCRRDRDLKIYTVQKGDTLYEIAKKHGIALSELQKANPQLKDPNTIMPGMKIKVPTGGVHVKKKEAPVKKEMPVKEMPVKEMPVKEMPVKEAPMKKEMPVKKEMPMKKEMPIKKEMPAKKEIPMKKEMPAKKENIIKKEAPVPEKPINVEIEIKKEKMMKKEPASEKPIKKMPQKQEKQPVMKEKMVTEPEKVAFKPANILPPTLPVNEEPLGKANVPSGKGNVDIPMMDDPFPNMMTPKLKPEEMPTPYYQTETESSVMPSWTYPHEAYGQMPMSPSYYPGLSPSGADPWAYTSPYSGHPVPVQPMPTSYSPCGCEGTSYMYGSTYSYSPGYVYGGAYGAYGQTPSPYGYSMGPEYAYEQGTTYPTASLPDGEVLPGQWTTGAPATGYSGQEMSPTSGYPGYVYSPTHMPYYGQPGYPRTNDGPSASQQSLPTAPKWGDED